MRSLTSRITKYVVTCYLAQGILSVNHCSTYVKVGNLFDCQWTDILYTCIVIEKQAVLKCYLIEN